MNEDTLNKKRLKEDIKHSIFQFQKYAELHTIERNNYIVDLLNNLLKEAMKMQLLECELIPTV